MQDGNKFSLTLISPDDELMAERLSARSWVAKLPRATDIPWAKELMLAANSYLTTIVDESSAVATEPLTMVADRPSAVEPMHNIDNRLSEPMFDAEKPSAVMHDD